MTFKIEINTENAAFESKYELSDLLRKIIKLIETNSYSDLDGKKLLDSNGNSVGFITIEY